MTNLKIALFTLSGQFLSFAQAEAVLRIISLLIGIFLTLSVYVRDRRQKKKNRNE